MIICLGTTPAIARAMVFQRLEWGEANRAVEVHQGAAGKAVNTARVLKTLNVPVLAMGFAGGATGRLLREDLDRAGVRHEFLEVAPPTRTCVTVVDRGANHATELIEESAPVAPEMYDRLLETLAAALPAAKMLILSGTLTPNAPQDFYARCVNRATQAGVGAIIDAKGEPLNLAITQRPLIAKPNRIELAATIRSDVSTTDRLQAAMTQICIAGAKWVVVTMGAEGAVLSDGSSFWRITTPPVPVVSPIGSGDSFAAGLAAGIVAGSPVPQACRLAAACAAANAMTALAGHIRIADVQHVAAVVKVDRE